MLIGVLALQGDFAEHIEILTSIGFEAEEIRASDQLEEIDHLIIPGGESTTMSKLLKTFEMDQILIKRVQSGALSVFGTCAGAILLSDSHLNLIDCSLERNAYGRQIDSFATPITVQGIEQSIDVSFIRAPKITRVGDTVEVLATHHEDPILVQSENIMIGTFHPEARGSDAIHRLWLEHNAD